MMRGVWKLLRFLPRSWGSWIKSHSSWKVRLWLRERLGGGHANLPTEVVMVADGRKIGVHPDRVFFSVYYQRDYEPETSAVIRALLRDGDHAMDVGANFGWHTTLMASLVGSTGTVHAFEPALVNLERIRENLSLNSIDRSRVVINEMALGDKPGTVALFLIPESSALFSRSNLGRTGIGSIEVPMSTLDAYVAAKGVRFALVKCDVEGSELSVLKGGRRFLADADSPAIIIEANERTSCHFGFGVVELGRELEQLGYNQLLEILDSRTLRHLRDASAVTDNTMILALKQGVMHERLLTSGLRITSRF